MQRCKTHKIGKRHLPYRQFSLRYISFESYECRPIEIHTPNGIRLSFVKPGSLLIGKRCSNFKRSDCRVQFVWDPIYRLGRRTVTDWRNVSFWDGTTWAYDFRPKGSRLKCSWCSDRMRTCKSGRLHKHLCRSLKVKS